MSKYNVGYILMLNYIHTLFSNLQLKDIKSDVIGYFSIVIVTVRGFSLQINNTLFNWETPYSDNYDRKISNYILFDVF